MKANKRRENGFNLAFLDVMACGLGAVLLILIIVNFNNDTPIPSDQIEKLEQELSASEVAQLSLSNSINSQQSDISSEQALADAQAKRVATLNLQQQALQKAISQQQAVIAELETAIAATAPETANDTIELPAINEETYLLGLVVEGQKIGILVDSSASMTDESLIEIIKRKLSSDQNKRSGPKWQRTLRIAKWMLTRLPENAKVAMATYNETASVLGAAAVSSANVQQLISGLNQLVPHQGTNLQTGLEALHSAMPDMTDLYIITDGLPSLINATSGFSPSRNCNPLPGKQATITGECRVAVMQRTLDINRLLGVKTNIVLLPLEGDPQAAALYWQWASFTGGTFISPAGTWP